MSAARVNGPVAVFTYVGNLGCIRFPPVVRAAAGVKRGDRLAVSARGRHALLLEKLPVGLSLAELEVAGCACQSAPEGCEPLPCDYFGSLRTRMRNVSSIHSGGSVR